jgi:type I restriction enzyme S subunit
MKRGWTVTKLGDLTDLVTKGTTPTSIGHEFVEEGINFVKVESITTTGQFIEEKFAHITPTCHAVLGRSQLQAGDILFSIAGALGRTGFVTDDILPANTNQALAIIRLKRNVGLLPKFVLKALETGVVLEQIEKFKGGVAQQNLSLAQVRDFQIALPPLAEQQRIVGLLDEAFAGLATAKANAEKNLQNARALFESHLQSVFTQRGKGWEDKRLGEICSFLNRGISPRYLKSGGICVLNQKCIRDHRVSFELSRRHDINEKKVAAERLIQLGDVLVNSTGTGTLGRVAQLRETPSEPTTVDSHVTIVRPIPGMFYTEFFGYMLVFIENGIKEAGEGCGGQTELARSVLAEKFSVSYPLSLSDQSQHVVKLDSLSEETQRLARLYERKHAALEAFKKSLLHRAFAGGL